MPMADISVARAGGFQILSGWWQGLARWWLSELRSAVPSNWLEWANNEATPRVLLRRDQDAVVCQLASAAGQREARFPLHGFGAAALDAWLIECGFKREQVLTGPVLERDLFFLRHLTVPKAALEALPNILEQEVLRRTPFDLSEIWHAAISAKTHDAAVLSMCHWIVRRDRAEAALAEIGLSVNDIDFLAVQDANADPVPVISFGATANDDPEWAVRAIRILFVSALVAIALGLAVFEWGQSSVAAGLETSLAEARQGTHGGRLSPDARLLAMKADPGILEIWNELSRILPEQTFLNEVRIADGTVTVSGFSANAARLVRTIDQSPLFSGAALAAAITPDTTERKDRFSIKFRVRGGRSEPSSGSDRSPAS
jgi:general secretion pathway protein L